MLRGAILTLRAPLPSRPVPASESFGVLRTRTALLSRGPAKAYDVDLTYTSNAIEGNTLTLRETAELIEHGITVGGKPLRDHLEAVDHYNARVVDARIGG